MGYTVTHSYGDHLREKRAETAKEAREIAAEWVGQDRPHVRVQMPDGQTWAFPEFDRIVSSVSFGS